MTTVYKPAKLPRSLSADSTRVAMPAIASKPESISKRISSPKCWRFNPARSSFARPWPAVPKVRSVRRSDGSTERWPRHRPASPRRRELSRATSSRSCSQTSIFSLQIYRPSPPQGACAKHSQVARNGTSDIACRATITGQASHRDIDNSTIQMMHHVEGYTDLEWSIDARNRR